MKIAFLHYHFKIGGVATVVRQQMEAIKNHCDVMLISGEPLPSDIQLPASFVPGLSYDHILPFDATPENTADAIISAMIQTFGTICDVLHVHNPLLSKNKHLLTVLNLLKEKGITLLLQIHDFAEDGRPQVYYKNQEYPSNCHYAVINSRDYHILIRSGLDRRGLHMLENVVSPLPVPSKTVTVSNSVLYPVRAIRRKNIGEAILLSLFFKKNEVLMITQPPNSDEDIPSYEKWKEFAGAHDLMIKFEAGLDEEFSALVASAKYLITTSVSEGFGFSFLEPWTADKGLRGRLLLDICNDFVNHHISLNHLYPDLRVPVEWIGLDAFYKKWTKCMAQAMIQFGISEEMVNYNRIFNQLIIKNKIDFGILDESFQQKVIEKILSDKEIKKEMIHFNPLLKDLNTQFNHDNIKANKEAILNYYHPDSYSEKLLNIYSCVSNDTVSHKINKTTLLKQYLKPENLSLLKWGRYGA